VKKSSTIEIVVSTMNEGIYRVLENFKLYLVEDVIVTIIHQITDGRQYSVDISGFRYFAYFETGLPTSRNRGLEHAIGDILIPTDDDVSFDVGFCHAIRTAFEKKPDADIITFKAKTLDGAPYKHYPDRDFRHNWRTLLRVSSIEICLNRETFIASGARWDFDYGLGAAFPGGLEVVFLQDCRRAKLSIYFEPSFIVCHPAESSGKKFTPSTMRLRGAILSRAFNILTGAILSGAFYVRKRKFLKASGIGLPIFLKSTFLGIKDYIKWSR